MNIFIICPVRDLTVEEDNKIQTYISKLENQGHSVHYPPRNTNQNDDCGVDICSENAVAIRTADEVHIYWNGKSKGSLFDFGMAFVKGKRIRLINYKDINKTPSKSFNNVLLYLHKNT